MMVSTPAGSPETTRSQRPSVPPETEPNNRFAPSPADQGAACAQQILEEFRKALESIDLKAEAPKKRTRKKS